MTIELKLSEDGAKGMQELMSETGLSTYRELFDSALSLFEWAANEIKDGRNIASVSEERQSYRVVEMPALQQVARRRPRQMETGA